MNRYVIDTHGPDAEVEHQALSWLVTEASERGTKAAIVVPGVQSIRNLDRVLGRELAAYAEKNRVISLNGVTVHLYTPKTQPYEFDGPVLVLWADMAMVEHAERLGPPAICATGWSEGGLDDWKRAWGPIDPRTGQAEAAADDAPSAVRGAVASLSGTYGNDVVHPMDKKSAINAFKALRIVGIAIDSVLVRALAIQHGWEPDAADRLEGIAHRISEGRTVQGGDHLTKTAAKERVAGFESQAT